MVLFFSILLGLLAINALLLIFSVNGAKDRLLRPIQRVSESTTTKLWPRGTAETEYKEAV